MDKKLAVHDIPELVEFRRQSGKKLRILCILGLLLIALIVILPTTRHIALSIFCKIILIYKIISRIIRRVNVDHLDFTKISLLQ